MEENKKEEVKSEEFKEVKKQSASRLSPEATILLTIAAAAGMIVLGTAIYAIIANL